MKLCDYGCGQEAKHKQTSGKWCCSVFYSQCPELKKKNTGNKGKKFSKEHRRKMSEAKKGESNPNFGKFGKQNPFYGKHHTKNAKQKQAVNKYTINYINKKYSFFSKIEEMRYNPDKPGKKEIQVHCKNHECENSKEKGGWFTPAGSQLSERIRQLESDKGNDGAYLYCSQCCKDECPLYNLYGDPYKENKLPYTPGEYQTFRTFVLERDTHICQFCGKQATHVHHERPQKLEPFYTLEPDFAWSCCEKCHYEKGHKDECSTGNLSKIVCSVESQKFLNQLEDI